MQFFKRFLAMPCLGSASGKKKLIRILIKIGLSLSVFLLLVSSRVETRLFLYIFEKWGGELTCSQYYKSNPVHLASHVKI